MIFFRPPKISRNFSCLALTKKPRYTPRWVPAPAILLFIQQAGLGRGSVYLDLSPTNVENEAADRTKTGFVGFGRVSTRLFTKTRLKTK